MSKKLMNLTNLVSKNECSGLNIEGGSSIEGVFTGSPVKCIPGDGEMIFIIKFREKVSITHMMIEGGMDKSLNPEYVKVYANTSELDFSDVEDVTPTENINLSECIGKQVKVNVPKFRNVSDLCLYFKSEESDTIQVNEVKFYGTCCTKNVDFAELKKNPVS